MIVPRLTRVAVLTEGVGAFPGDEPSRRDGKTKERVVNNRRSETLRPAPKVDLDCEPDVVEAAHPAAMEATARSPKT